MNPYSYPTVGDPAVESHLISNAVYITPIFTEDAVPKTFMFDDSTFQTAHIDILADKYPLSTAPDPLPVCSNLHWSSCMNTTLDNSVQSSFICDLAKGCGELSHMLSPQVIIQRAFQDYPIDVPVIFPVSKSFVPDSAVSDVQFLEGGVLKETEKLMISAYGDHKATDSEEGTLLLPAPTEREKSDMMDQQYGKTSKVETTNLQCNCGHNRLCPDQQFEQPDMFMNDVYAALTSDISWRNEPESDSRIMNDSKEPKENGAETRQRRRSVKRKLVDLRTLLIQCAEAVGSNDFKNAKDFLTQIRLHASPCGNASERKAHYFGRALEARLAGTGSEEYAALVSNRIPAATIEACKLLISACPFMKVSNFFTTEMIMKTAKKATKIHIVHFGVPYGLQWSSLIQRLSKMPGNNPPLLRVTGIDLPDQPGLMESEARSVEETGHLLANFCKQFNIPFEYNAIKQKWENIQLEDLKIDRNEVIVVSCLYRLRHIVDEMEDLSSPRDTVLNLIRKINPNIFIHGIVNGTYNAPFFVSRFREALYYFSSMFDMLQEIAPSEGKERMVMEENIHAKDILNVVACEGSERVERPETYKQWQVRNLRAGLRQLPLNQEMLMSAKAHVKLHYHRDFLVDGDKNWMLQGWKGKTLYALSFWKASRLKEVEH
ncbi:Transcription factor GRAS [Corchorus olitorius]|uniref:Transcription factor GRAS n=1 Tax=Corchorus olitorius TaxID=93759 RepID=A0A1R3J8Q8_9ROSI|nr:Transcription factor GRAS [Corchorus olitorius]